MDICNSSSGNLQWFHGKKKHIEILARKMVKHHNATQVQYLARVVLKMEERNSGKIELVM